MKKMKTARYILAVLLFVLIAAIGVTGRFNPDAVILMSALTCLAFPVGVAFVTVSAVIMIKEARAKKKST